jgi:hypothetical protein
MRHKNAWVTDKHTHMTERYVVLSNKTQDKLHYTCFDNIQHEISTAKGQLPSSCRMPFESIDMQIVLQGSNGFITLSVEAAKL